MKRRGEKLVCWGLIGLALVVAAIAVHDQWTRVGQPWPGFGVMENQLVGIGGARRGGLEPFDSVRAVNGLFIKSGREIQAEARLHPPGTTLRYFLFRRGQLVEAEVPTQLAHPREFRQYLLEGLLPALLLLGLGTTVITLKPGTPDSRLFLTFCLIWFVTHVAYNDSLTTYRFTRLFLTAWAFSPAVFIHLALTFPARRTITRRSPRIVWAPYALSAVLAVLVNLHPGPVYGPLAPAVAAVYWGTSLVLLILSLGRTAWAGSTPLARQRARVLMTGFAVGYLLPVLGTVAEAVLRVTAPYLHEAWRLTFLFPLAVAYAMVRYNLFDLRAVLRLGTIYSVVTGLVVLAYAVLLTRLNVFLSQLGLEFSVPPIVPAVIVSLAVVLLLNPVYVRTQALVDRLFFRQRYNAQQAIERLAGAMTTVLDLHRIVELITRTVNEVFHPRQVALLIAQDERGEYRPAEGPNGATGAMGVPENSALARCLAQLRAPLTRESLREDPRLAETAEGCLAQLDTLGADLVVPVLFRERVTGLLALGPRRSQAAYTTDDFRLLRLLVNQSAVALENAKAYSALQAALRRVEILESVRASLSKFVPRAVQDLIEAAPDAPELDKREADVSVLFVDIVGYTRLSARHDPAKVNFLVERYFGAFLDEILAHGGDVNETAGDGLMVIFQDPDPQRHAQAAVRTALGILRRARQINAELAEDREPITLHVGVNSGTAAVGATKIEGTAGTRWTYTASGSVTNVAARLAALGEGESVLIGPETRRRLTGAWPLEDLGERRLKNVEEPLRVFRLAVGEKTPSPSPPPPVGERVR